MNPLETPHQHGGIVNYFQGATIHNIVINGNMTRSGSESYNTEEHTAASPSSSEQRVLLALRTMQAEQVLRRQYDYAWVMGVMNESEGLPHFNTPQSFLMYLQRIGMGGLPGLSSITKKNNSYAGTFPDWTFTDCDSTEANRRINVGKRFLSAYRKDKT